jgi:hypothetical protein
VRERGLLERYYEKLEPEHHAAMRELIIGVWVPIDLALAHYRAMNKLEFGTQEQFELGRINTLRIQKSFLGTMFRLAGAGATPFTALEQLPRIYERVFRGGSAAAYRCGPKDARVELKSFPLADIPYFREGFRGLITGSLELFTKRAFIAAKPMGTGEIEFRMSWV